CLAVLCSGNVIAEIIKRQPDVRLHNLGLGKSVFLNKCSKCHTDVESDAPQLRSVYDWESRIDKPLTILISHAINGHGKMPAKGGFEALTKREVSAAVAYVVDQSRRLIINENGNIALNNVVICTETDRTKCSSEQVDNTMLLELIWLLTNETKN
ncbi:MAG: hypothetical protein HKP55_14335, partial [Gammaproteobacteria bacterium]|nr:hypothetical protein [Gammaproteobacteria bacterium]